MLDIPPFVPLFAIRVFYALRLAAGFDLSIGCDELFRLSQWVLCCFDSADAVWATDGPWEAFVYCWCWFTWTEGKFCWFEVMLWSSLFFYKRFSKKFSKGEKSLLESCFPNFAPTVFAFTYFFLSSFMLKWFCFIFGAIPLTVCCSESCITPFIFWFGWGTGVCDFIIWVTLLLECWLYTAV